jgi:3-oxoacyl-[acyl-carrier protein] reductase
MRFENQHVVITGGTRGLGRAMSLSFLAEGAVVHATYRSDTASADSLREAADEHAERLMTHAVDVTDGAAVEAFWAQFEDNPVSVLVNNAGIRRDALLAMMKPEDWEAVLATNLTGGYQMSRFAVLNMMGQRYGRILFVTSPAGRQGFEGQGNYGASKAGQQGLMRSLCKEVAKRGITVNCVSPGFVATELLNDLPDDLVKQYKKDIPMKRFGKPEEIASAVMYLASKEAAYITGTTLEVTGGL